MIKFVNLKDSKGSPLFGSPFFDTNFEINLASDTVASLDLSLVPGADACMISSTGNLIVSPDAVVSLPVSTSFTRTDSTLNRSIVYLKNIYNQANFIVPTTLYFVAPDNCYVFVSFFSVT